MGLLLATIVDTQALWRTVVASFAAGVGVALVFSLAILGATRLADMTQDGRRVAAVAYGVLALVALAAAAAVVTIGIIVMTSKS